jgi:hypothetical protein
MRKLSIKNIIEFRKKSLRSRQTLIRNLRVIKKASEGGGGDYWVTGISALSSAFKANDNQIIKDKIIDLSNRYELAPLKQTKDMYQRNIEMLSNYEDFDFSKLQPCKDLEFLSRPLSISIININGLPVQILPSHVFLYNKKSLGAIWFVAKLEQMKIEELGAFTDALSRYLTLHYSDKYQIDPSYCLCVDTLNQKNVAYQQILDGKIPSILDSTIDDIKLIP